MYREKTTGNQDEKNEHPEGVPVHVPQPLTPLQGAKTNVTDVSGGRRCALTTGYFLAALRAVLR